MYLDGMNLRLLLNYFQAGISRCNYWKSMWGMTLYPSFDCSEESKTMNHIVQDCPLYAFSEGLFDIHNIEIDRIN